MKAVLFYGKEDIRIEDVEKPVITDENDVLIKVSYCGICGSDITAFKTGNYVPGIIIGHEFSGIVEDTGKNVEGITKGNKVVGSSIIPCGKCNYCLSGKPNLCKNSQLTGITINGAFAEYVKLPSHAIFKIPEELDLKTASLAEPLSIVIHAVYNSKYRIGMNVLVQGSGPIGLLLILILLNSGAGKIIVSDLSNKRLELAKKLGNIITINPSEDNIFSRIDNETHGEGMDMVFDTTGAPKSIKSDFTLVKRGGEIVLLGIPEESVEADIFTTVVNEISLIGAYESYNEFPVSINLLFNKKIDFSKIITKIIKLEDLIEEGFKPLLNNPSDGKILVKIGGE